jgi:hypothetical protein
MAKINKAALKAYFQTEKIPTQSNFADLIDSVMNIPDGGGDSTLVIGSGDKDGAPYVNGYRFINDRNSNTYLIISCWDNDLGDNVPVLLFYFPTNSPSKYSDTITYHVLTSAEVEDLYIELNGSFNATSDDQVVAAIEYLALDWFKIFNRYNNNPPAPRIVTSSSGSEYITWYVYPAIFNNKWVIGYALECIIEGGAGSTYQHLMVQGNNIVEFDYPDNVIVDRLRNGVWYKKAL